MTQTGYSGLVEDTRCLSNGIALLASGMDGTLLNAESRISDETAAAVKMAQSLGVRFVAVTGRAWNTAHLILQEAGIETDYVLLNGAEFRTSSGSIIYQEALGSENAEKIMDELSATGMDFEVNTDQGDFSTDIKMCQSASELPDLEKFWSRKPKILKFFAFSDDLLLVEKIRGNLKDRDGITLTSSAPWNIEITSPTADKGMMLKRVTEFYQASNEEVVVFGDGENDETMFRRFSHSCAVENAVPTILCLAEKVIESNQKNGVAKEIHKILGGQSI